MTCLVLYRRLMSEVPEALLRREYRKRVLRMLWKRPDPNLIAYYLVKCAMHYHQHTMTEQMASGRSPVRNSF